MSFSSQNSSNQFPLKLCMKVYEHLCHDDNCPHAHYRQNKTQQVSKKQPISKSSKNSHLNKKSKKKNYKIKVNFGDNYNTYFEQNRSRNRSDFRVNNTNTEINLPQIRIPDNFVKMSQSEQRSTTKKFVTKYKDIYGNVTNNHFHSGSKQQNQYFEPHSTLDQSTNITVNLPPINIPDSIIGLPLAQQGPVMDNLSKLYGKVWGSLKFPQNSQNKQ